MSKAEQFIKDYTRNCSNQSKWGVETPNKSIIYVQPWLTPDDARRAVEIAMEETTEIIKRLLKEKYLIKSVEPLRWVSWEEVFDNLKQSMKDE